MSRTLPSCLLIALVFALAADQWGGVQPDSGRAEGTTTDSSTDHAMRRRALGFEAGMDCMSTEDGKIHVLDGDDWAVNDLAAP